MDEVLSAIVTDGADLLSHHVVEAVLVTVTVVVIVSTSLQRVADPVMGLWRSVATERRRAVDEAAGARIRDLECTVEMLEVALSESRERIRAHAEWDRAAYAALIECGGHDVGVPPGLI